MKYMRYYCKYFLLIGFFNRHRASYGSAYHRIVAHTDKSHHFNVSGNGGGAGKLSVAVHSAHGVGQTVGSGTRRNVVGVEGTSCTAARSYGEVFLSVFNGPLL